MVDVDPGVDLVEESLDQRALNSDEDEEMPPESFNKNATPSARAGAAGSAQLPPALGAVIQSAVAQAAKQHLGITVTPTQKNTGAGAGSGPAFSTTPKKAKAMKAPTQLRGNSEDPVFEELGSSPEETKHTGSASKRKAKGVRKGGAKRRRTLDEAELRRQLDASFNETQAASDAAEAKKSADAEALAAAAVLSARPPGASTAAALPVPVAGGVVAAGSVNEQLDRTIAGVASAVERSKFNQTLGRQPDPRDEARLNVVAAVAKQVLPVLPADDEGDAEMTAQTAGSADPISHVKPRPPQQQQQRIGTRAGAGAGAGGGAMVLPAPTAEPISIPLPAVAGGNGGDSGPSAAADSVEIDKLKLQVRHLTREIEDSAVQHAEAESLLTEQIGVLNQEKETLQVLLKHAKPSTTIKPPKGESTAELVQKIKDQSKKYDDLVLLKRASDKKSAENAKALGEKLLATQFQLEEKRKQNETRSAKIDSLEKSLEAASKRATEFERAAAAASTSAHKAIVDATRELQARFEERKDEIKKEQDTAAAALKLKEDGFELERTQHRVTTKALEKLAQNYKELEASMAAARVRVTELEGLNSGLAISKQAAEQKASRAEAASRAALEAQQSTTAELDKALAEVKTQSAAVIAARQTQESTRRAHEAEVDRIKALVSASQAEATSLRSQLGDADEKAQKLAEELRVAQTAKGSIEQKLASEVSINKSNTETIARIQKELEAKTSDATVTDLRSQLATKNVELSSLKAAKASAEQAASTAKELLDGESKKLTERTTELDRLRDTNTKAAAAVREAEGESASKQRAIDNYKRDLAEAAEKERAALELKGQTAQLEHDKQDLERKLAAAQSQLAAEKKSGDDEKERDAKDHERAIAAETAAALLQSQLDSVTSERDRLAAQLAADEATYKKLLNEIRNSHNQEQGVATARINETARAKDEAILRVTVLEGEITRLHALIQSERDNANSMRRSATSVMTRLSKHASVLDAERAQIITAAQTELAAMAASAGEQIAQAQQAASAATAAAAGAQLHAQAATQAAGVAMAAAAAGSGPPPPPGGGGGGGAGGHGTEAKRQQAVAAAVPLSGPSLSLASSFSPDVMIKHGVGMLPTTASVTAVALGTTVPMRNTLPHHELLVAFMCADDYWSMLIAACIEPTLDPRRSLAEHLRAMLTITKSILGLAADNWQWARTIPDSFALRVAAFTLTAMDEYCTYAAMLHLPQSNPVIKALVEAEIQRYSFFAKNGLGTDTFLDSSIVLLAEMSWHAQQDCALLRGKVLLPAKPPNADAVFPWIPDLAVDNGIRALSGVDKRLDGKSLYTKDTQSAVLAMKAMRLLLEIGHAASASNEKIDKALFGDFVHSCLSLSCGVLWRHDLAIEDNLSLMAAQPHGSLSARAMLAALCLDTHNRASNKPVDPDAASQILSLFTELADVTTIDTNDERIVRLLAKIHEVRDGCKQRSVAVASR